MNSKCRGDLSQMTLPPVRLAPSMRKQQSSRVSGSGFFSVISAAILRFSFGSPRICEEKPHLCPKKNKKKTNPIIHSCRPFHWTHPNFDLRIHQDDVAHLKQELVRAVVYQQSRQSDQVVLSEQPAVLGVVQPERNSPFFKGHANVRQPSSRDGDHTNDWGQKLLGLPAPGASSTLSRSLKPQFSPSEPL